MKYVQSTHYRYNPFQRQDFIPDVAHQNRKIKLFPSEIPQGQQFFGREYRGKKKIPLALGSQIGSLQLMKSPEKFIFENRIALDKDYSRNLDTIDIEGAASGTRVSQAVRNKMKARQQLMRTNKKFSSDMQNVQKTHEAKRRQIAQKQYQKIQQMKEMQKQIQEKQQQKKREEILRYKEIQEQMHYNANHGNNIDNGSNTNIINSINEDKSKRHSIDVGHQQSQYQQDSAHLQVSNDRQKRQHKQVEQIQRQKRMMNISINNRHRNNPEYYNNYFAEYKHRLQEHQRNMEIEQRFSQEPYTNKSQLRRKNPTNLSFGLTGENIVKS